MERSGPRSTRGSACSVTLNVLMAWQPLASLMVTVYGPLCAGMMEAVTSPVLH